MLIKKLIQRLLDSRTTAAEAAHSAMPKPETPTIVSDPVTDKTWHSLIAPFDGYFSCKGITKHMLIENSAAQWSGVAGLTSGGYMGFTLPMSKGSEVRYQLDHNSTDVMITFAKTIGGYLRSIVSAVCKRGQLCLSRLSLYLPRNSFRTKRSGYLSGRSNWLTPRQSLKYQRQTLGRPSQCRLTVGQLLKTQTILQRRLTATSLKGNTKCSVFASVVSPIALQQFLFRAKKVKPSALPFTQTVRTFPLEHLKHFRLANLETGGALC